MPGGIGLEVTGELGICGEGTGTIFPCRISNCWAIVLLQSFYVEVEFSREKLCRESPHELYVCLIEVRVSCVGDVPQD
jgi:hypothetical protein